ncbi:hypothetical protein ONS96_012414 [Cadophora gregata f. sp. sojae]|nr:hypothetical protein ONS96_012414 [Cadophora gregata f. sp. sojae]
MPSSHQSTSPPRRVMVLETSSNWRESSPGIYTRPLDEPDLYYTTNAKIWERTGQTASAINVHVGISLPLSPEDDRRAVDLRVERSLRYAWKQIRYHCPVLASSVELDPKTNSWHRTYRVANEKKIIDKWLEETFTFCHGTQTAKEFLDSDPPVPFSALFVFPNLHNEQSQLSTIEYNIILRCRHDVMDGMAAYAFMDKLLGFTAEAFMAKDNIPDVIYGNEHRNLAPPFRTMLGVSSTKVFTDQDLKVVRDKRNKNRENALSVPSKNADSIPGKTRSSTLKFTFDESQRVMAACKARKTTVTQVIHAAIALAVRDLQARGEHERQAKYVSYVIMSLRKYCREPYNGPEFSMMTCHANSTSLMVVDVIIPSSASTIARTCPKEFSTVLKFYQEEAIPKDLLEAALCFAARTPICPSVSSPLPAPTQSASVSLSSRGITDYHVKHRYGPFEVLDPWCMGTELSIALGLAVNTWKGEMCLCAGYNMVFHEHKDVQLFLESVKRTVMEGLDIV